ncbi:hypothetical protein DKG79_01915 [Escherichia fergusonii]|nr:hypothetical protein DKG79_01915 [Escherichia fergusonii]
MDSTGRLWTNTDNKNKKSFIKQYGYGQIRTFEEAGMVPIIGVEPTTFALRICSTNHNYLF